MRDNYDYSNAKRAKDVPHLAKLQSQPKGKTRITIMLDNDVLESFKQKASDQGLGYQTLINQTLRMSIANTQLDEETVRRIIKEEIAHIAR